MHEEWAAAVFPTRVGVNRDGRAAAGSGNPYSPRVWG